MTDLNTFLLQEATQAASEGREPCFHYSPTLATAIIQVHQRGVIEDSLEDGQEFLDFIDNIGHQFHPFNSMKVFAVSAVEYDHLDPQQKFVFSQIMEFVFPDSFAKFYIPTTDTIFSEIIGEGSLIVNDQGGVNRLFLGPVCNLHIISPQTNFNSLSPGRRQLIPNFRLPPGQTWARFQTGATLASVESEDVSEESSSAPKKSAERIPRPPNPFIIYRAAHHKSVAIAHPEDSNNEISKKLGRQWQSEPDEIRDLYRAKAADIKTAFMAAHPNYKYQPRKSSEVKRRAKKNTTQSQDDADDEE